MAQASEACVVDYNNIERDKSTIWFNARASVMECEGLAPASASRHPKPISYPRNNGQSGPSR